MDGEGLVATEAPIETGFEAPVETATPADTGTQEVADGATEPEHATGDEGQPEAAAATVLGPPIVDGRLSAAIKPILEKLKAENPAAEKAIRNALFLEDRLKRELPGGLAEIKQLRQHIDKLGGEEGIQEMTGELDGWRDFDNQYTAGDPKVLEFLTAEPQAKDAFLKIAPAAFEKFRELNPDGYGAYVSQVFQADLYRQQIPWILQGLRQHIPAENAQAQELFGKIENYIKRIDQLAANSVTPAATKPNEQDQTRIKELETRETNLRRTEWRSATDKTHAQLYQTERAKVIGDRRLTSEQRATITELYGIKLQAILKATPKFNENLDRYFASNKKDGFTKYVESVYREAVPKALRAAVAQAGVGAKPGPAPGTAAEKKAPPIAGTAAAKPIPGFQLVNAKPKMETVDRVNTSSEMWLKGQAVLRDGKKVSWKV